MSLPSYPEYKDSGVEWLGDVPSHWEIRRADALVGTHRDTTDAASLSGQEVFHYSIPVVQATGDGEFEEGDSIDSSKLVVSEEQVLVSKLNPRKGTVCIAGQKQCLTVCSSEFVPLVPRAVEIGYLYALVQSDPYRRRLESLVESATRSHQRVLPEHITKFTWAFPPIIEQTAIATFLDRETGKIDALVAEQEKLIELLKEKRQAVISHAVTKGLDPTVPMKDSGIEWLGEVPEHWEVIRLKWITPEITVGIVVEPSKYYVDDGVPALRSLNVQPGRVVCDNLVMISEEANKHLAKSMLRSGDLVAVRSGQPGTTAVVPQELDGVNCIDLIIIRKPVADSENFLCWYMASDVSVRQFSEGSGGAIQQHFNIGTAKDLLVVRPPRCEQDGIVGWLEAETERVDRLVSEAQRAIDLLKERRSALISAAVTGKIDVRGLVAQEEAA